MQYQLISRIIELSNSKTWEEAKKEWIIFRIVYSETFQTCLCGHYPIKELCFLRNKGNEHTTVVGNCCINKFFDDDSFNKIFSAIAKDRINKEVIEYATRQNLINEKEMVFLLNIWRKRKLSERQFEWRDNIKRRILNGLTTN